MDSLQALLGLFLGFPPLEEKNVGFNGVIAIRHCPAVAGISIDLKLRRYISEV